MPQNIGFDTNIKSLVCSEPMLQFHSLKLSLASYSPSTFFLTFRSIWGSRKWSQMIPHTQKPGVRHQNQVSRMARSKVTIIWHSISLGPTGGRFWGKVGKLQMAGAGTNLDYNEPNFLSLTHFIIYNRRQGVLHGYWQHNVLWLTLISTYGQYYESTILAKNGQKMGFWPNLQTLSFWAKHASNCFQF